MLHMYVFIKYDINPVNHTGYYYISPALMFKNLCFISHTVYLFISCDSHNNQQIFP